MGKRRAQPLRDLAPPGRAGARRQGDQLLPAMPGEVVPLPQRAAQRGRRRLQHEVPAGMTVPVVDRLEMIQVEQHQRAGPAFPAQARRLRHGEADEAPAIGDAEERVGGGQPVQLPVGGPQGLQLLPQSQGVR